MIIRGINICVFMLVLITGCGRKRVLNRDEFSLFIKENSNDLKNTEVISGVKYTVAIEPPELRILKELNTLSDSSNWTIDSNQIFGPIVFSVIINDSEEGDRVKRLIYSKKDYYNLVGYANTLLQRNFTLKVGSFEVPCSICHMEPPSSANPELRIALSFDYDSKKIFNDNSEGCQLVFNDEVFRNGEVKFSFKSNKLKDWPRLKI